MTTSSIVHTPDWIRMSQLLLDSFEHFLSRSLIDRAGSKEEQSLRLFELSSVVVAHGTESDPILCYANQSAINLWETDLDTLLVMPSRKTAEPSERSERADMLRRGHNKGYIEDYRGVRVTARGRRFAIENAIIWNLIDRRGENCGQAATFSDWRYVSE